MKSAEVIQKSKNDLNNINDINETFKFVESFVNKTYLNNLSECKVVEIPQHINDAKIRDNIRLFKISKLIYDKNENSLNKLINIYSAAFNINASIILIIDSDGIQNDIYIGVRKNDLDSDINMAKELMKKSFIGNFPGSELNNINNSAIETLLLNVIKKSDNSDRVISTVSSIPSLKSEDKEDFVQGIEKLIDSMRGQKFSAVFISDPVTNTDLEIVKKGYENIYSQLSPFAYTDINFGQNESDAVSEGLTEGFTESINESISKTQSYTKGNSTNESTTKTFGGGFGFNQGSSSKSIDNILTKSIDNILTKTIGFGVSASNSKGETVGTGTSYSDTNSNTSTTGTSKSTSTQENKSMTTTVGSSKSFQIKIQNKTVENTLEQIDNHIKRLNECKNFGMWNCAAYFIADDSQTSKIAASNFKSLISGEISCIENSVINTWGRDNIYLKDMGKYILKLHHPMIDIKSIDNFSECVTPGSLISGKELAIQLGLPKKSIMGLPIMEMAEFGRNVTTYDKSDDKKINLGKIFHMGSVEELDVNIDLNSLGMHTFVTGSTGSGKSNTIYKLLNEVNKQGVKFLVIEPAKGEYKEIFGGREDVNVFGTNPKYSEMLKINPFKFTEEIHILEHIDRLIEIFNACWPMYAAMPAVLKEAIEMAYERYGWDLETSICVGGDKYPTFNDLLDTLDIVIKNSAYSEELKSNYTGALCTRVKSLTNGILGRIFTSNEIDNEILFDENTIVDLSRVGSTETKSLITGILFIKLQEHRMTSNNGANSKLRHVTVLEEAHNLLRKTSTSQSQEGTNLQGKSVEMISNSIAEMRTYGEGFIIADQAPNLLDDSAIRNTNTKIILRLPQQEDRESVGKSASLNDDQINEIPKLKTGVAVVYQNNWMEPVLCKVDEFKEKNPLEYNFDVKAQLEKDKKISGTLLKLLLNGRVTDENKIEMDIERLDIDSINEFLYRTNEWLDSKNISNNVKDIINRNLDKYIKDKYMDLWEQDNFSELCEVVNSFIDKNKMTIYSSSARSMNEWTNISIEYIRSYVDLENNLELEKSLLQCLLSSKAKEDEGFKNFYFKWVEDNRLEGGKMI